MKRVNRDTGKNDLRKSVRIILLFTYLCTCARILTTLECASRKSPANMARITSQRATNIARCAFICPSSSSKVTSLKQPSPIQCFSIFSLMLYGKNRSISIACETVYIASLDLQDKNVDLVHRLNWLKVFVAWKVIQSIEAVLRNQQLV